MIVGFWQAFIKIQKWLAAPNLAVNYAQQNSSKHVVRSPEKLGKALQPF